MRSRSIRYSADFENCVADLGGWRAVDEALEPIIDGLRLNPYGFKKIEDDLVSVRYALTERCGVVPALIVAFTIDEDRNVTLEWCDENTPA